MNFYLMCWMAISPVLTVDHVAVRLFLSGEYGGLELFLPCRWISKPSSSCHEDTGSAHWATNPGKSANAHHKRFSAALGIDTLQEIEKAKAAGAILSADMKGFHSRNSKVAASEYLIAITWASGAAPSTGGSLDTWNKCTNNKIHIPLEHLMTG
jgi:hypothetical protein